MQMDTQSHPSLGLWALKSVDIPVVVNGDADRRDLDEWADPKLAQRRA